MNTIKKILYKDSIKTRGALLIGATILGNFFNFLYNAYLGRVLNLEDFAQVSFFSSILALSSVFSSPFGKTVNYKTGYLIGKQGEDVAFAFWRYIRQKAIFVSIVLGVLWLIVSPFTISFFRLPNIFPLIVFTPVILFGFIYSIDRGLLSSRLRFESLAGLMILESVVKLGSAFLLVYLGLKYWTYAAIPLSIIAVFLAAWYILAGNKADAKAVGAKDILKFPSKFFTAALLSGLSTIAFLSSDVVLAKHYLAPSDAGLYSLLSLIAKMVFFLGSFASPFIMPLVSRNEGANKDSARILKLSFAATFVLSTAGFISFGLFGSLTTPILFGEKVIPLVPFLIPICFAMLCFSFSRVFTDYYLAKKHYTFSAVTFLLACFQLFVLSNIHNSITSFVTVMSAIWILHLVLTFTLHSTLKYVKVFESNIADLLGLFVNFRGTKAKRKDKLKILIFNWRDTKHKWAGGAEVYIHQLAKRWVKDGNKVTIFCGNDGKSLTNEVVEGVDIVRRGGFYTVYFWGFLYYIFRFRNKYDVIIDSENGIPFFTPLYTRKKTFLLIYHVHQEVFRKSLKPPFSWLALFLEAKLMPNVYRNIQFITISPSSKDEILKHKLTKSMPIVIYSGVNLEIFRPKKKSRKPTVLYLGRLQYYKSLHVFIVAAKRILEKIPDAEFVIAGEGEERKKLQRFAKKLGVLNKIKFEGKVSEREKVMLFQKAWVFVNPSFTEGWGLTTIEANACGTPTVASDVPGLCDSISDSNTGILVKYGNYQAFTKSITEILENQKLRQTMSRDAIQWAKYFSWEKSANIFLEVIGQEDQNEKRTVTASRYSYFSKKNYVTFSK